MGVAVAVRAQGLTDGGVVGPVTVEAGDGSPVGTPGLWAGRRTGPGTVMEDAVDGTERGGGQGGEDGRVI